MKKLALLVVVLCSGWGSYSVANIDSTHCGDYVMDAYKTLVEQINNKACPAKLVRASIAYKKMIGSGVNAEEIFEVTGTTTCDKKNTAQLTFVVDTCDLNRIRMHLNDDGT